ncbi:hypothetical protein RJ641_024832 [Dillenia turbinata]|uniref:Uncharacterized protein n=1 Tax=Dillenia turbinata TaxID=194707 RepID=A0AAN8W0F5_9MAGN
MSNMQEMTSSMENDWRNFMEGTEASTLEETAAVQAGRNELEEILVNSHPQMQKNLEQAEYTLSDIEDRPNQANTTLKEKDSIISSLQKFGKLSAEKQLKEMEEDAQLFISTKEEFRLFDTLIDASPLVPLHAFFKAMQSISEAMKCAANEERKLLEKIAELLAKLKCYEEKAAMVREVRVNVASRTCKFHEEMPNMQEMTSSLENDWRTFVEGTEASALEETAAVRDGRNELEESFRNRSRVGSVVKF